MPRATAEELCIRRYITGKIERCFSGVRKKRKSDDEPFGLFRPGTATESTNKRDSVSEFKNLMKMCKHILPSKSALHPGARTMGLKRRNAMRGGVPRKKPITPPKFKADGPVFSISPLASSHSLYK